jgi:dipeptidyl aminopeptidase/acylaminoacyl peptidase
MGPDTDEGSKERLLGKNPPPEIVALLSNEKQVTAQTPPCFVWHTWEDGAVKVENSLAFASALRAQGVPFDLHIYEKGKHGIGLGKDPSDPSKIHPWTSDCLYWLRVQGFVK